MRAQEFITERLSKATVDTSIMSYLDNQWESLNPGQGGGCLLTSIFYAIINATGADVKKSLARYQSKAQEQSELQHLQHIIWFFEQTSAVAPNGDFISFNIQVSAPSIQAVISNVAKGNPAVLIFDSTATSPLMNEILRREKEESEKADSWDGTVSVKKSDLKDYSFPPPAAPTKSSFLRVGKESFHSVVVIGYNPEDKTFLCREPWHDKSLGGYFKLPTNLSKYYKILSFDVINVRKYQY